MEWFKLLTDDRFRFSSIDNRWNKISHNTDTKKHIDLREVWAEKGWIKSFDYLMSKRAEAENEKVKFRSFCFEYESKVFFEKGIIKEQVLKRHSVRQFSDKALPKKTLKVLTEICNSFVSSTNYFDIYFFSFNIEDVEDGLYKIDFKELEFKKIDENVCERKTICNLIAGMPSSMSSALTLFITCDFNVAMNEITETACLRRVFAESGMLMQRIILGLCSYDIFGVPSPAISDSDAKKIMIKNRDDNIWPIYSCALGYKK